MAKKPSSDDTPKKTPKADGADSVQDAPQEQPVTVNAQFIKDLSFESPNAPSIFAEMQASPPDINLNINVKADSLQDDMYEIILDIQADCKVGEKVAFILELEYAGVFTLKIPEEHLQAFMFIECPRLLFPFARNILSEVSRDGGFPPIMLGPVDFLAMFQAGVQDAEKKQAEEKAGGEKKS